MPPKKDNIESLRQRILSCQEAHDVARNVTNHILDCAMDLMVKNHHDRAAIPYTVQCLRHEMLDVVEAIFLARDSGSSVMSQVGWEPLAEIKGVPIDTWARGVIHTRKKEIETLLPPPPQPSSASSLAMPTNQSKTTPTNPTQVRRSSKGSNSNIPGPIPSMVASITQSVVVKGGKKPRKDPGKGPDVLEVATAEDASPSRSGPDEIENDQYQQILKLEAKKRQEAKQLSEKVTQQMEEMKNLLAKDSNFTIEAHSGQVIQIKPLEAVKAQSKRIELRVGFPSGHPFEPPQPTTKKTQEKEKVTTQFVLQEEVSGPMVEGVTPAAGVAVKEGEQSKRTEYKVPKARVTRQDFKKIMDTQTMMQGAQDDGDVVAEPQIATPTNTVQKALKPVPTKKTEGRKLSHPSNPTLNPTTLQPQQIATLPSTKHTDHPVTATLRVKQGGGGGGRSRHLRSPKYTSDGKDTDDEPVSTPKGQKPRIVVRENEVKRLLSDD